jgi:hypothetical protein
VKKFLVLAVALVLCLSGAAFAIQAEIPADTTAAIAKGGTQVTIGGELRFRGGTYQNTSDFNKRTTNGPSSGGAAERMVYESRIRLGVEAKVSPNTIGYIQLEAAGGADQTGENHAWGSYGATNNQYGSIDLGESKSGTMQVMQAWLQHSGSGLLGIPAYIKVGHQPITVGAGVFYKHNLYGDDAIVAGITPIKGLDITVATVKLAEAGIAAFNPAFTTFQFVNPANDLRATNDVDLYTAMVTYAINKNIVIGADVSYLDLQIMSPLTAGATINQGFEGGLWNIGLNAKAKVSGFSLYGTADIQTGSVSDRLAPANKVYFKGLALTAGAAYTFAPVTLALDLGYGSGDNKLNNSHTTFITSKGHTETSPFVYNYLTVNAAGNYAGGLQNTLMAKFSASADVMKDLNVGGALVLLNAAKKSYGDGNLLGGGNAVPTNSRYIGTEIDLNASYQIDKGLKYFVEGGYLFAGNFWKGNGSTGITGVGYTEGGSRKVSDPWALRHGIQLNF